ncbi:MAG: glutathione S-transferase family protein [Rhodospirillaceae bacterium]|jgi:GSH-dependent disulfide-bond oxidoreductase|nr:glutathione S-transferase family protein [Rhodospirillaceae bacterium]MBT4486892.1 glutathione S-transferase family protein [Rhodospirillaceae bacterium]MBT5195194.1 glutathione S-transferase family protein [Rhodospirillaceae bacterium]MBT5896811.1 glutathione S-transferase family protein [Rhodospirillaceae bacterium]MBT6430924.1 glutathione S-transferase family protein [Rhodospirillaceae bacterium]
MIDLYTFGTPNGRKASIMLEEVGLPYTVHPIHIGKDEQFAPEFLKISPNNKIPAIVDNDVEGEPISVFETGAILIYLAEKTASPLLPTEPRARADVMQWLMWQMAGQGPMFGQAGWFVGNQPDNQVAIDRYVNESIRLLGVMDRNLGEREYMAGADYTLADVATYSWCVGRIQDWMPVQRPGKLEEFTNVNRWLAACIARPAVAKGMTVP